MKLPPDFRKRVLAREWLTGTFLNLGSPVTVEVAGLAGFDWVLIDHEHGPGGEDTLLHQLQAAAATPAFPVVRIAQNETPRFKRVLDMGALGVMVPYVSTAGEARAAVSAMRYPPHGIRGVAKFNRGAGFGGDFEEYYAHAHERLVSVIQIETIEAVNKIDEIAAVDGADVLFVGPTDLSYNMGIRDQLESAPFTEALRKVSDAAQKHGKAAGILVHNNALVPKVRELGYTFTALGSDGGAVRAGLLGFVAALKSK
ncbi:MAG: HpcH/HpaI aldolase family protein [Opitutaceae bacterium]